MLVSSERPVLTLHMGRKKIGSIKSANHEFEARKLNHLWASQGRTVTVRYETGYFMLTFNLGADLKPLRDARSKYSPFRLTIRDDKITFRGKIVGLNQKQLTARMAVQPGSFLESLTPA